jgi:hypothetical protein
MKNKWKDSEVSGLRWQGLKVRVREPCVRGCSGLGTSWSKAGEGSKIQLSGAKHRNTEAKVYGGWKRIWTLVLNM